VDFPKNDHAPRALTDPDRTLETVPASAQSDKEAEQFDESLSAC
jgi:hypothetical protein